MKTEIYLSCMLYVDLFQWFKSTNNKTIIYIYIYIYIKGTAPSTLVYCHSIIIYIYIYIYVCVCVYTHVIIVHEKGRTPSTSIGS